MDQPKADEARELAALLDVARSVASTLELEPLLNIILDNLKLVTDYAGAGIAIFEDDHLRFLESRGASAAEREPELIGVPLSLQHAGPLMERWRRHEPVIIDDVRADDEFARAFRKVRDVRLAVPPTRYIRSFLGVPLVHRDQLIGLLTLSHDTRCAFTAHHARLTMAIATHAAAAIENARLFEETRAAKAGLARQVERLRVLTSITNQLLAATELDAVLSVVVESAMRLCDTAGAAVGLIQSDGREIAFAATAGEPRDYFEMYSPATIDDGFLAGTAAGRALVQGRAVIVDDYATWGDPDTPHEQRVSAVAHQLRAFIVAPLLVDGAPIGLLRVHHTVPRSFAAEDAALIQALADQAALAIEHTRLLQRGQEAAILEERARLARELHDSVTQSIFSLGMLAQAARTQHVRAPDRLGPTLERVSSLAQEALIEMRSLLFELQPAALAEQGLASALDRLVGAMRMRGDLTLTYSAATAARLDANAELALFRIAQESLANVIKHAHATEVAITLSEADECLILTVIDNGAGFDPTIPAAPSEDGSRGGMGLRSMRERAASAGITLVIHSSPATGTAVTATAPLSPA